MIDEGHQRVAAADERLAGLVRLGRSLAGAHSVDDLAERAGEEARFALSADAVSLSRLEREHGLVRVVVNVGALAPGEERFPRDETYRLGDFPLLASMVDEATPWLIIAGDEDADPAERALLARMGMHSALAAPIMSEGRIWGELFAARGADRPPYGEGDLAFAEAFAGLVTAGLSQVEALARVQRLAYVDPLTGLGNRRLVEERLEEALDRHAGGPPVSLVMADVNRLKQANDLYGHEAGDKALIAVASALSVATGKVPGAVAGRMGGDEFCAVLPGYGLEVAEALAAAFLRGAAEAPYGVSVACGIAASDQILEAPTPSRLFALADAAQYVAKRSRSTRPVVADPTATERRAIRAQPSGEGATGAALDALAALPADSGPEDRLAAVAAALAARYGAVGWVVSRVSRGAAVPVRHDAHREGVLSGASVPASTRDAWFTAASARGTVVTAADEEVPLAAVRGTDLVAAAAVGGWLVELLCDEGTPLADAAPTLRAVVAAALTR